MGKSLLNIIWYLRLSEIIFFPHATKLRKMNSEVKVKNLSFSTEDIMRLCCLLYASLCCCLIFQHLSLRGRCLPQWLTHHLGCVHSIRIPDLESWLNLQFMFPASTQCGEQQIMTEVLCHWHPHGRPGQNPQSSASAWPNSGFYSI